MGTEVIRASGEVAGKMYSKSPTYLVNWGDQHVARFKNGILNRRQCSIHGALYKSYTSRVAWNIGFCPNEGVVL